MKKILSLVLALAMMLSLCSFASADEYTYGSVHGVSWTLSGKAAADNEAAVAQQAGIVSDYLAATGNTLEYVSFPYDFQSVGAMFEGGQMPTVIRVAATEPVKLAKNGWGRDISEQVKAVGIDLSKFNQEILATYMDADGKLYGLPYTGYAMCLIANGQLFIDAGLVNEDGTPKLPTTWEEVIEYGNIINEKTGKGGFCITARDNGCGFNYTNLAWTYGADLAWMNEDGTFSVKVNSEENIAAMEMYQRLINSKGFYGDPLSDTRGGTWRHLMAGECAMTWSASDSFGFCTDSTGGGMPATNLYVIPTPAGPGGQTALTGGSGFWFSNTATDEQVIAALEFFMQVEGYYTAEATEAAKANWTETYKQLQEKTYIFTRDFPVYESGANEAKNAIIAEHQTFFDYEKQGFKAFFEGLTAPGALTTEEEGDTQNLYAAMTSVIQELCTNPDANVRELLDDAQVECEILYADFNAK